MLDNNERIYIDCNKLQSKSTKILLSRCAVVCVLMIVFCICGLTLWKEFRHGIGLAFCIFDIIVVIAILAIIILFVPRYMYYESGNIVLYNGIKKKTIHLSNEIIIECGHSKILEPKIGQMIIIKTSDNVLGKYGIEYSKQNLGHFNYIIKTLSFICEKYDMEFVNYWGDMNY